MNTTIETVTTEQINNLRRAAGQAGDYLQVAICNVVLGEETDWEVWAPAVSAEGRAKVERMTRDEALESCVDVINDAES